MGTYINNLGITNNTILSTIEENPGLSTTTISQLIWDKYNLESKGYKNSTVQVYIANAIKTLNKKGKIKTVTGRSNQWYVKKNLLATICDYLLGK